MLFSSALAMLGYEVFFGGARPEVLTVCLSLLLAPAVLHYDERLRDDDR